MKISVIGGGNIGTLMAAEFAHRGHNATVYTSKPQNRSKNIAVFDSADKLLFNAELYDVTNSLEAAVNDAEIIFITFPAEMFTDIAKKLLPYIHAGQKIGIIPGSGGAEFAFKPLIDKGAVLFGLQRVHSIARLKEKGKSVYMLGRKAELQIAAIPFDKSREIASDLKSLLDMPCVILPNYLSVTLTPSNPILHTTRLCSMFKDYTDGVVYPSQILFYESWTDKSSDLLIKCDGELQSLCERIPLDLSKVISLKNHYESFSVEAMTNKISNISAFKGIATPMVQVANGWIPDFSSRYFSSDFCFGLKIIKDIAALFDVKTPNIDSVWDWYCATAPKNTQIHNFKLNLTADEFIALYK